MATYPKSKSCQSSEDKFPTIYRSSSSDMADSRSPANNTTQITYQFQMHHLNLIINLCNVFSEIKDGLFVKLSKIQDLHTNSIKIKRINKSKLVQKIQF